MCTVNHSTRSSMQMSKQKTLQGRPEATPPATQNASWQSLGDIDDAGKIHQSRQLEVQAHIGIMLIRCA